MSFFCGAWRKYRQNTALSQIEAMALDAILAHPEYHAILENPDSSGMPENNPFLHFSLHLAVAEQLSIDQPPGIKAHYEQLMEKTKSNHDALHIVMECLGEMIWLSQRNNTPPDQGIYFECLERRMPK